CLESRSGRRPEPLVTTCQLRDCRQSKTGRVFDPVDGKYTCASTLVSASQRSRCAMPRFWWRSAGAGPCCGRSERHCLRQFTCSTETGSTRGGERIAFHTHGRRRRRESVCLP